MFKRLRCSFSFSKRFNLVHVAHGAVPKTNDLVIFDGPSRLQGFCKFYCCTYKQVVVPVPLLKAKPKVSNKLNV
jgi:hypothetical protein